METTVVNTQNAVSAFNFENHQFDVITDEQGNFWFIGKQVAKILGYSNTKDALSRHVDEEDKKLVDRSVLTNGVINTVANHDPSNDAVFGINTKITIINESGLYSLILKSQLPSAKKFKRWVTSEVLPSLRKNGSYSMKPMSTLDMFAMQVKILQEQEKKMLALQTSDEKQNVRLTA